MGHRFKSCTAHHWNQWLRTVLGCSGSHDIQKRYHLGFTVCLHGAYNGHRGLFHLYTRFLALKGLFIPIYLKRNLQPSSCDIRFSRIQDQSVVDQQPRCRRHLQEQCVKQCWWYSVTQILNPLISLIDTLERRQLAVIRSMSMNQTAHDPRTINGAAKVENKARAAFKEIGVEGLIAKPMN